MVFDLEKFCSEKEMMSEHEKIQMTKAQAVRELAKDLMEKATVESTSDDRIKIIIDIWKE